MCNSKYAQFSIQLTNFLKGCNKERILDYLCKKIFKYPINWGWDYTPNLLETFRINLSNENFVEIKWDEFEYIYMYEPYLQKWIRLHYLVAYYIKSFYPTKKIIFYCIEFIYPNKSIFLTKVASQDKDYTS